MRSLAAIVGIAVAALFASVSARADWLVQPVSERVQAGELLDVIVYVVNDSALPIDEGMPERLPANAIGVGGAAQITLEAVDPPATLSEPIASGAFRKQRYRVRIPETLRGTVQIALERLPPTRLYVAVDAAPADVSTSAQADAPVARLQAAASGPETPLRIDTIPEPVLSPHEPMYFLLGGEDWDTARFQLSFKYRLFDQRGALADWLPGIGGIHFGLTQTSLWDIGSTSAPFRDTSYRPALFYYNPQVAAPGGGRFAIGLETGLEHESNGRDGPRSRSINTAYVKPSWRWFIGDAHYFAVAPKIYTYLERDDNPDIARYRGYVDLNVRYGKRDGWLFATTLRKGTGPYGSVQLDASYPIRRPFFANAGGYVHFQYFNGYGETLLDYNVRRQGQFRIGFSIVR